MKPFALIIAFIFTLNQVAFAQTVVLSPAREAQLIALAEQNPNEFLRNLTDEELRLVQRDLKAMVAGLNMDFAKAVAKDKDRTAYKVRNWAGISTVSLIALTVVGTLVRFKTYKGPSVDNDAVALFIFGGIVSALALTVTAGGQVVVWLSPEEADKVQERIDALVDLSNAIDSKL